MLTEIAGLPGAPARIGQASATYQQGAGNDVGVRQSGPTVSGTPPTYHVLLPDQLNGPPFTASQLADATRETIGPALIIQLTGYGPAASPAQRAVTEALLTDADLRAIAGHCSQAPLPGQPGQVRTRTPSTPPWLRPGSPVDAAARRFAALPVSARRTWLLHHLPALRAARSPWPNSHDHQRTPPRGPRPRRRAHPVVAARAALNRTARTTDPAGTVPDERPTRRCGPRCA